MTTKHTQHVSPLSPEAITRAAERIISGGTYTPHEVKTLAAKYLEHTYPPRPEDAKAIDRRRRTR